MKYTISALENPLTQQFNQTHLQNPLQEHKISQKNQISTTIKIKKNPRITKPLKTVKLKNKADHHEKKKNQNQNPKPKKNSKYLQEVSQQCPQLHDQKRHVVGRHRTGGSHPEAKTVASLKKTKAVADAGADSVRDSACCVAAAASLIGCFVLENSTSQEF